jgi:ADP-ribosylation factor GTPase-activating protein 2/3
VEEEKRKADEARRAAGIATPPPGITSTTMSGSGSKAKASQDSGSGGAEMERLGMGVRKMGFGSMGGPAASSTAAKKKALEDDVKVARERFGNQKGN